MTVLIVNVFMNGLNFFSIYLRNCTGFNFNWEGWSSSSILIFQRSNRIVNWGFNLIIIIEWVLGNHCHIRWYLVGLHELTLHYITSLANHIMKWWTRRHYLLVYILRYHFRLCLFIEFLMLLIVNWTSVLMIYWVTDLLTVISAFSFIEMGLDDQRRWWWLLAEQFWLINIYVHHEFIALRLFF